MEDNLKVNGIQQTLNDERDDEKMGKIVSELRSRARIYMKIDPEKLENWNLAWILSAMAMSRNCPKKYVRFLTEAAKRLQRQMTTENAITHLQKCGWMQEHDREILSPYACITRLEECGWMENHDRELLKHTRENLNRDIDALEAEKHNLIEADQKLREQLVESETHRKELEKGIESLRALEDETNRRLQEQLQEAELEKKRTQEYIDGLREELEKTREDRRKYYERANALADRVNTLESEAYPRGEACEALPLYRIHDFRELAGNPANVFVDLLRIAKKLDRRLEVTIS